MKEPREITKEEYEESIGGEIARVWYFDFGKFHCFRFFVGRVMGKWCINIGLRYIDFGLAWDKKEK